MDLDKAIDIEIKGEVNRLQDIKNAQGDIVLMGEFRNIDFVKEMIPEKSVRDMISFPKELFLNCDLKGDKGLFYADLTMLDTHEFLKAHAFYSLENENYSLGLKTTDLDMTKFMPKMGIGITDVDVNASGHGFDPFDSFTKADLTLDVHKFSYTEMDFEELSVKLSLDRSEDRKSVV